MKKYTVYNYLYGEMDTPSHKMFLLMDDGVKFDVDLYKLSYEDREGLEEIEGYDENEAVFEIMLPQSHQLQMVG